MSLCELFLNNPVWSEWALVVVGMLTLIVIAVQTIATAQAAKATQDSVGAIRQQVDLMERQTAATETAANAAKASADALTIMERAWLVPDLLANEHHRPHVLARLMESFQIGIPFTNFGRTPAWIVEWCCERRITASADFEWPAEYGTLQRNPQGTPIPPGRQEPPYEFIPVNPIQRSEAVDIINGRMHLHIFGFVRYRDIFCGTGVRETYFCFRYFREIERNGDEHRGWAMAGPPEANRHT